MKKYSYLIVIVLIFGLVLTGCSLLSNIGQAPATDQSGITYLTKGGPTVDDAEPFPLFAGQDMFVGNVLVWNDDTQLCVKYQLSPEAIAKGWLIYETHVDAATTLGGIPQKNGNPPPGKLRYGDDELPGEEEAGPYCIPFEDIIGFTEGLDLCDAVIVIAAHAVIEKTECEIVVEAGSDFCVSDTDTMVVAGNVGGAVYPKNAVLAHKPGDAGSPYPPVWDTNLTRAFDVAAEWIWESYYVVNPVLGDVVTFEMEFEVPGIPAGGTLYVAADNGFAVYLNDVPLGYYNLSGYPPLADLKQSNVNTTDWWNVQQYDLAANLQQGTNTLKIVGVNEYMNPDDGGQVVGTQLVNPGGVIFEFSVAWDEFEECTTYEETAWGGLEEFPGKNWATYFEYTVTCPSRVCIDFSKLSSLNPGDSIEGAGTVYDYLNIDAVGGEAVLLLANTTPGLYGAPNGGGSAVNGCMSDTGGFGDTSKIHEYVFTFSDGKSVSEFSLRMLDFGDLNPDHATYHLVTMTAFSDVAGTVEVDTDVLEYNSDNKTNPTTSSEYGNLYLTGDACTATTGQPGNWTWEVSGNGIVRIELEINEGRDPNIAFDNLCFTIEQH